MHGANREGADGLEQEVATADRIERVAHWLIEPKRRGGRLSIDGERRAGERSGAERGLIHALGRVDQPAPIALEHLGPREQMMGGGFLSGFSKSAAKRYEASQQSVSFKDVAGLDGVKQVTSNATEGRAQVFVELLLGADPDRALADVKSAIDRITSFPEDAEEPVVRPYWLTEDIEAAVKAAVEAGGELAHPPMEIPGHGTFAIYFQGGIQNGLWQV